MPIRWDGTNSTGGDDATFGVSGSEDPDKEQDFPNLIVGMSVCKPGESPGKQGARVLASLAARGHEAGLLAADRAFSSAKAEDFQLPALGLGYRTAFDYKEDSSESRLSTGASSRSRVSWYSPSIPETLISATADYRNHRIDEDTYRSLLKEAGTTWPFPEAGLRRGLPAPPMSGGGSWPTVRCPLEPASTTRDNRRRLHIAVGPELAANPPRSCTQQSVTLPPEAGANFRQELLFGSPQWKTAYNSLRNTNEGMNGYLKDPANEALDDPGRRRIHGVAAQSVLVAFLVVAANVRKIRTFMSWRSGTLSRRRPRRRTTEPVSAWRPPSPGVALTADPDPPLTA